MSSAFGQLLEYCVELLTEAMPFRKLFASPVALVASLLGLGARGPDIASAYNGVYNTSITPSDLPWNTYNYCNAPHVNAEHYTRPTNVSGSELVYMNVMIRHHKARASQTSSRVFLTLDVYVLNGQVSSAPPWWVVLI